MKPTIVTAVMLPDRRLIWKANNTELGELLLNPDARVGALLFYPGPGYPHDRLIHGPVTEQRYSHERFLLDGDAVHVQRTAAPPLWDGRPAAPILHAGYDHAFVERRDIRRALWVIEHWLEDVL
jgi:hypothetical protein